MFSFALSNFSSVASFSLFAVTVPFFLEGRGKQYVSSASPFSLANWRRWALMSSATTREAPRARASAHASSPMAPTPNTSTLFGGSFCEDVEVEAEEEEEEEEESPTRRAAWMRTESGSARAASSSERLSGSLFKLKA